MLSSCQITKDTSQYSYLNKTKGKQVTQHYSDYTWINGIPYGVAPCNNSHNESYKISMDPYRKRISIEQYQTEAFQKIIYDSSLFDFRHLKLEEQTAWQKTIIQDNEIATTALIRNQDDRLVLIENYCFESGVCRKCRVSSPHGIEISIQHLFYEHLGDAFNGVVMYDTNAHPIMFKIYEFDKSRLEFTKLLEQQWDMQKIKILPNMRSLYGRNQMQK